MKQLVVFDLDGTLAESKSALDAEMAQLLEGLLGVVKVAVISGGAWQQFETQILAHLPSGESLKNLSLLPTCGTRFYRYRTGWELLYAEDFTDAAAEAAPSPLAAGAPSAVAELEPVGPDSELWRWHAAVTGTTRAPTEMANRAKKVRMAGVLSKVRT